MAVLIQALDAKGTWEDREIVDVEYAGRFLGYGTNADWYRAVDPETRIPLTLVEPRISLENPEVREFEVEAWNVLADGTALCSGDGIQVTLFNIPGIATGQKFIVSVDLP